jgi:hypothetical protein
MAAVAPLPIALPPAEQRMLLYVSWKEYVLLRDVLDGPALRMTYSRGVLELMRPSPEHELWKKNIARFVELYAHVKRIDLRGYGSTTFKREAKERGAEPDECYLIGKKLADYPEIVIEVVHTVPLIDKLDVVDAADASVSCKFAAVTASPPCKYSVGGCSDGHTYALACDASSCTCEVDGVPNGRSADLVTCQTADTKGMDAACGWDLVLPGD